MTGDMWRSPPRVSAANPRIAGPQTIRDSRPYCADGIIDDECIINSNRNVPSVKSIKNQIHLFDELELLRTENFQLRLRVYNAEQRADRLSAAAIMRDQKKPSVDTDTDSDGTDTENDGTDTDSDGTDIDSDDTDASSGHVGSGTNQNNAAAVAKMAKTAMSSIQDLLELNRRLLSLMTATVSAKSASVLADNKQRLQKLQSHIEKYAIDNPNNEKKTHEDNDDDSDDEFFDASATNSGTLCEAWLVPDNRSVMRQSVLRLSTPPSSTPLDTAVGMDEGGVGSDVTRLQRQCRPIRSARQLTGTDLWVRNRKFGKLEQKRCMPQVVDSCSSHTGSSTGQKNAAVKATTEVTVHTIHDLLALNQPLLALMAATVSGKSVSVSADNKRSLQQLQSHIEKYAIDSPTNEANDDDDDSDDEYFDASATNSGTLCQAWLVSADRSRQNVLLSPPPPPQPPPSTLLEGVGSDMTCLRRQRTPIRSVHQLMKTELWARNRMFFGRVEQQQIMTQVSYAGLHMDTRPAKKAEAAAAAVAAPPQRHHFQQFCMKTAALTASPMPTKGIPVIRPTSKTPCTSKAPKAACTESQIATASTPLTVATITTPPLVFPEMNFFISCDEEEDEDDDDCYEDFEETNCISSSEDETTDWDDCDEEPVLLAAVGAPVASSTSTRRHCRTHQPIKGVGKSATVTMMTSSSPVSVAAEIEENELKRNGVITAAMIAKSPCTVSVSNDLNKRRRCMLPRRCFSGGLDVENRPRPSSVVDAQVQCDDGNVVVDHTLNSSDRGDSELQVLQLRRELDARQRENSRLNDILLRFQQGRRPGDGGPRIPSSSSVHEGTVNDSIANLLPPLMTVDDDDDDVGGGDADHQRCRPDGVEQQLQLQLIRVRKLIVDYEHQELDSGKNRTAAVEQQTAKPGPEDQFNDAVRLMNHKDLVNVALPQVVERLHRALVVLHLRPENVASK